MALTRPTAYQINTVSTTISDPLTVLNQGSTAANIDIGFILNRSPSANVAIVWQASSNQFILANTSSSGSTNANITVSNYANLRAGNVLATTITTTNLVGDANITVTGSIIPSANVTYDLGSPTQRWREGWFSGSTIHIGDESISVDTNGKWTFSSKGSTVNMGKDHPFDVPTATLTGNITAANFNFSNGNSIFATINSTIATANTNMKGYVDGQITNLVNSAPSTLDTLNELAAALGNDANLSASLTSMIGNVQANVTTANTNMKGYVDAANTIQSNQIGWANASISAANTAITTANTNMKGYVDNGLTARVTSVSGTAPVTSSGGTTPAISMAAATASVNGYMTSTYASKLDGIAAGATNVTNTNQLTNGNAFVTASVTLTTAAQTNITSVGTLTSLAVSGAITVNSGAAVTAIINGATTGVGNIGSSTVGFNTVFAKSTSAQYADLAEVYRSDRNYIPGTVVVFGGTSEVTVSLTSHDTKVAGVVSTNPAYLMNSELEGVAVALQGRVPCRVLGPVVKGDRVVTSDVRGVAERLDMGKYQPGCIIGKALGTIPDGEIATIEVVVGRN